MISEIVHVEPIRNGRVRVDLSDEDGDNATVMPFFIDAASFAAFDDLVRALESSTPVALEFDRPALKSSWQARNWDQFRTAR